MNDKEFPSLLNVYEAEGGKICRSARGEGKIFSLIVDEALDKRQ